MKLIMIFGDLNNSLNNRKKLYVSEKLLQKRFS